MSSERLPLVRGANGECPSDEAQAEIERRWTIPAVQERIGEFTFSRWKVDVPLAGRPPRFSPAFFATVVFGGFGLIGLGGWAASRVQQGDFVVGEAFGIGLIAFLLLGYFGLFVVLTAKRRRRAPFEGRFETVPEGVSRGALPVVAALKRRGLSVGWLWFEGDAMRFLGAGFDFRLRREDFVSKGSICARFQAGQCAFLRHPEGVSEFRLRLLPGVIVGDSFMVDYSRWNELQSEFESWESGSCKGEPSLFPPLRAVPTTPSKLGFGTVLFPPLFLGALLGFAGCVIPAKDDQPAHALILAIAGAAFGLTWPFLVWSTDRTSRTSDAEANRVAGEESVGGRS